MTRISLISTNKIYQFYFTNKKIKDFFRPKIKIAFLLALTMTDELAQMERPV